MPDLDFDANEFEPNKSFDPIPDGEYLVVITESDRKPTKAGDGEYLELTLQVIEGEHQDRLLWDRLNIVNPSDIAVKIAKGQLSAICRAVGRMTVKQSEELHNIPLIARVTVEPRSDNGQPSNKIKGYKSAKQEESKPGPNPARSTASTPVQRQPVASSAGAGRKAPPWQK